MARGWNDYPYKRRYNDRIYRWRNRGVYLKERNSDHVTLKHIDSNGNWVFDSEQIQDGVTICSSNCNTSSAIYDGFLSSADDLNGGLFIVDYFKSDTVSKYNPDGQQAWSIPMPVQSGGLSTPKMILDEQGGLYYVWSNQGNMYGMHLDRNGSNVWQTDQELLCTDSAKNIAADYMLATDDGSLY